MNDAPSDSLRGAGDQGPHPVRMLWTVVGGLACGEACFELLLYWRPAMSPHIEAVLDAGFLAAVAIPLVYIVVYRPMLSIIKRYRTAMAEIRTLRGIITICSACKNIRTGAESWEKLEAYVRAHSEAEFSHGLCPACIERLYPDHADWIKEQMRLHRPYTQDAAGPDRSGTGS